MTTEDSPATTSPRAALATTHPGGMRARRVMPTGAQGHLDPFVVFEQFYIEPTQGFDTHPHRGFEIVSYMLEGGMRHDDSMGNAHTATAGDAMRITTGSGFTHSELPAGGACTGLQLWVNLPRELKSVEPSYADASADELPREELDGATVTTLVGDGSPLDLRTSVRYDDVSVSDAWEWRVPDGWQGFLYVYEGEGTVDGAPISAGEFVTAASDVSALASETGLRAAAVAGRPHDEPIRQRGPFVD